MFAAGSFSDPSNGRIILAMALGLVVVALVLATMTVWWWRHTLQEHPSLGPLDTMGARRWRRADFQARQRRLDEARPAAGGDAADVAPTSMPVDLSDAARADRLDFDDLADPDAGAEAGEDPSAGEESSAGEKTEDAEPDPEATPPGLPIDPLLRRFSSSPFSSDISSDISDV